MSQFTIIKPAIAELDEKGSRFIGHLVPWAEFEFKRAALREDHRKASHHVTAFRRMLPDNRIEEGAKDDGEPAGTSGMPTLKVLIGASLVDAGIIIVRYFGGTKLGAGGLARAYAGTAVRTVEAAVLVPWHRIVSRTVSCRFEDMSSVERNISAAGLTVISRDYIDTGVTIVVEGPEDAVASIAADS
ncbi:YigZ family protein [Anderseniella sp. Alg231-50]|uniref:YigZ family protein n=1 Tax=Anderseniella sp. Alg231-50 TaxID=1922226 RepID=UPI000D552CB7